MDPALSSQITANNEPRTMLAKRTFPMHQSMDHQLSEKMRAFASSGITIMLERADTLNRWKMTAKNALDIYVKESDCNVTAFKQL